MCVCFGWVRFSWCSKEFYYASCCFIRLISITECTNDVNSSPFTSNIIGGTVSTIVLVNCEMRHEAGWLAGLGQLCVCPGCGTITKELWLRVTRLTASTSLS